ncbi:MAG TPA: MaoC family dehydratase N-terminal domain-containing protein [Nocardioides sp.]|jgi:acyl dehydratase|nr:MaoC family dehydratase N-terminal domain-containing protein [Nocardioides sp.]HEX3297170.1 MaoC family dehydratase N-terminal domain-containing protein [Nocardioides sp.]
MAVDGSLAGRTFPPTEVFDVTEQAVRDFAAATGTPYASGDPAPATFAIVVAFGAMQGLMADPEVGIELHHVVHGQQRFVHERPVVVGDRLSATLTVSGVRQIAGTDIISTSSAITDDAGALVCTAEATLVHQAGAR